MLAKDRVGERIPSCVWCVCKTRCFVNWRTRFSEVFGWFLNWVAGGDHWCLNSWPPIPFYKRGATSYLLGDPLWIQTYPWGLINVLWHGRIHFCVWLALRREKVFAGSAYPCKGKVSLYRILGLRCGKI